MTMASNSKTKVRPNIHSEGHDMINKVVQFQMKKSEVEFKIPNSKCNKMRGCTYRYPEGNIC
jgi:hypothetical protein